MPVTIDYRIQTQQYQPPDPWLPGGPRDLPGLDWAAILQVLHAAHGLPSRFHVRDFLATMTYPVPGGELTAVFCSQGRRRGEVLLSIPATVPHAATIMQQLGDAIAATRAAIRDAAVASGISADWYDTEPDADKSEYGYD